MDSLNPFHPSNQRAVVIVSCSMALSPRRSVLRPVGSVSARRWFRLAAPIVALAGGALGWGVLAAPPAGAIVATLFVATAGSDSGNCQSAGSPCATVSYALTQAGPGDTIEVSGTIDDHPSVNLAVTIKAEPGGSPAVLDGTGSGTVVSLGSSADVTIQQVMIENGSTPGVGGGIDVLGGTLTLLDSTIANSSSGIGGGGPGLGGGIDMDGGTLVATNSTFADDTALNGGLGGAIDDDGATVTITDSTFANNSTQGGLGDAILFDGGTSVVAGDIFGNASARWQGPTSAAGRRASTAGTTSATTPRAGSA